MAWELLLMMCLAGVHVVMSQLRIPVIPEEPVFTCQPITDITVCESVGYLNASFPNLRNQMTQTEANAELNNFQPLIRLNCSGAIVHFLCAVYAPFCEVSFPDTRVRPCRNLCQHVRAGCEDNLLHDVWSAVASSPGV